MRSGAGYTTTLLLALLGAGCASTPPSTFYTLTPFPAATELPGGITGGRLAIGIGPIEFPDYLDRPQLVSRASAHRLSVDELHRWGGSLPEDFLRVLSENLAQLLATSRIVLLPGEARFALDYQVIAEVLTFEAEEGGEAVLKVRWAVLDPEQGSALSVRETSHRQPLSGSDPEAKVRGLSDVLGAFSRDLASELRALRRA
jgi:uncharacterized lipoprotein YmbA